MDFINYNNSVSGVLVYCKSRVLSPYFRTASFLGWRPLLSHRSTTTLTVTFIPLLLIRWTINLINIIYTLLILLFIFSAYFLSYCTCYRGDGLPHLLPLIIASNQTVSSVNQGNPLNNSSKGIDLIVDLSSSSSTTTTSTTSNVDSIAGRLSSSSSNEFSSLVTNENNDFYHGNTIELINNSITCNNKIISHFIIPDLLHFASYLFLLYLLRTPECERLENLMERCFLQLSRTANWFLESRHLISTLRTFLAFSTLWIICSIVLHVVHFNLALVNFNCLPDSFGVNLQLHSSTDSITSTTTTTIPLNDQEASLSSSSSNPVIIDYLSNPSNFINVNHLHTIIIYITVTCLTVFDIICSAVVNSYAVHCQLNISFITSLCQGVREKRITFQEFYQRAEESRKFVAYLNTNQAISVSLIAIVFICKICLYLFQLISRFNDRTNYWLLILSALLWIIILLIPLIQAVRLSDSCCSLRNLGHELKARPFGYQYCDESDLNSLMAYTASLDMTAKLFNLPIKSSSIVLIFTVILILVPLFGQIGILSL